MGTVKEFFMNNIIAFVVFFTVTASTISYAADSCAENLVKIESHVKGKYSNKRIMTITDLDNDSAGSFKSEKTRENPGCVCAILDGKKKSCAVLLVDINQKEKIGPILTIINIDQTPISSVTCTP